MPFNMKLRSGTRKASAKANSAIKGNANSTNKAKKTKFASKGKGKVTTKSKGKATTALQNTSTNAGSVEDGNIMEGLRDQTPSRDAARGRDMNQRVIRLEAWNNFEATPTTDGSSSGSARRILVPKAPVPRSARFQEASPTPTPSPSPPPPPSPPNGTSYVNTQTAPRSAKRHLQYHNEEVNKRQRVFIEETIFSIVIARKCGHMVHPVHQDYENKICHRCDLTECRKELFLIDSKSMSGGISAWSLREKERVELAANVGFQAIKDTSPHVETWTLAKAKLANKITHLEYLAAREKVFEQRLLGSPPSGGWHHLVAEYSAVQALKAYHDAMEVDQPVTQTSVGTTSSTAPRQEYRGESSNKRKRGAEEEGDAASGGTSNPGDSRRLAKRRATFNEQVYLSNTHNVDDHDAPRVPSKDRTPSSKGYGAPNSGFTTEALYDGPRRSRSHFRRRSNFLYTPGRWADDKVDTSFANSSWSEFESLNAYDDGDSGTS